jgi:hypothetical protein
MAKVMVRLLKPLNGAEIGSEVEYSEADLARLERLGAVERIGEVSAAKPKGKAAAKPKNKMEPAPANKGGAASTEPPAPAGGAPADGANQG